MLEKLIIKNVALIDYAEINFTKGLNVLSGETGAGKSVILESLNFVLGAKSDKSLIRSGQNECFVSAIFNVENNQNIKNILLDLDFEEEDSILISRKFSIDGKSSIKLNGNNVTVSMLKKITNNLVDVHGQSEHYQLLSSSNQLKLVDKIGADEVDSLKLNIKNVYSEYKQVIKKIDELGGDNSTRLIRLDILNFQINEIESANLTDDEEDKLLEIRKNLINQEKIFNALNIVKSSISEEGGIGDILTNSIRGISQISSISSSYSELEQRLNNVYAEIDDIADVSSSMIDNLSSFEYDPDYVENRLELIKSLKKKYGNDVKEIISFLEKAKEEVDVLINFEKNSKELLDKKLKLEKELYSLYCKLSDLRRESSSNFSEKVLFELKELGMSKANFQISFNERPSFETCSFDTYNGYDEVDFKFSANLGEPLKSLSSVISGGEMSRFMLSIKVNSSKENDIDTFVFDEIDAGISGNIARVVAKKFAKISKDTQVIAITHLPQISSMADNNLLIEKSENECESKTFTTVKTLDDNDKIMEVVRLIGGVDSDSAKLLAKELINDAINYKNSL